MLLPREFTVAALADARPLALLKPRSKYEQLILVGGTASEPVAIFIGNEHRFDSFECGTADGWKGLLIPDVQLAVDEATVFDPDEGVPNGALVREGDRLMMAVQGQHSHGFRHQMQVTVVSALPAAREGCRAAFKRWHAFIGEGDEKRILAEIDLTVRTG